MRVSALSLAGIRMDNLDNYREDLTSLLQKTSPDIAILPAYSSLALGLSLGVIKPARSFLETVSAFLENSEDWNSRFLDLHSNLASNLTLYLVAGTLFITDSGHQYHVSCCFDPAGEICCFQRQTHLTRDERNLGLSRGDELPVFKLGSLQAGLIVGNDARHPEVGRILALSGADLVLHSGALEAGGNCWEQAAGIWAQVQQNQFWAVEAQLMSQIAGSSFSAGSAVIGPCEITPGKSGYLSRGYPGTPIVTASLDEEVRQRLTETYPLLKLRNSAAYADLQ